MLGLLRYVKGSKDFGLIYSANDKDYKFHVYIDAPWADEVLTRKSTTGIITYLGEHLVDCISQSQTIITPTTA